MAKTIITTLLFALFSSLSYAIDMSIIDYKNNHYARKWTLQSDEDQVKNRYEMWLAEHGRAYNALGEKEKRFEIFKDNLKFIEEHNNSGNRTYKVGLNQFADLTNEEYRTMYLGTRSDARRRFVKSKNPSHRYASRPNELMPHSVDWRKRGAVAPIKNQGSCGTSFSLVFF